MSSWGIWIFKLKKKIITECEFYTVTLMLYFVENILSSDIIDGRIAKEKYSLAYRFVHAENALINSLL